MKKWVHLKCVKQGAIIDYLITLCRISKVSEVFVDLNVMGAARTEEINAASHRAQRGLRTFGVDK